MYKVIQLFLLLFFYLILVVLIDTWNKVDIQKHPDAAPHVDGGHEAQEQEEVSKQQSSRGLQVGAGPPRQGLQQEGHHR